MKPIEYSRKNTIKSLKKTNPIEIEATIKSKHIFISRNIVKDKLYEHIQKHFSESETTITKVKITDAQIIFKSEDEIYIGAKNIYWYSSRVGKYYTKSNGEFDAEHKSEVYFIEQKNISAWKAVSLGNRIFLECQEFQGKYYRTIEIVETEFVNLMNLQKELNEITNASR